MASRRGAPPTPKVRHALAAGCFVCEIEVCSCARSDCCVSRGMSGLHESSERIVLTSSACSAEKRSAKPGVTPSGLATGSRGTIGRAPWPEPVKGLGGHEEAGAECIPPNAGCICCMPPAAGCICGKPPAPRCICCMPPAGGCICGKPPAPRCICMPAGPGCACMPPGHTGHAGAGPGCICVPPPFHVGTEVCVASSPASESTAAATSSWRRCCPLTRFFGAPPRRLGASSGGIPSPLGHIASGTRRRGPHQFGTNQARSSVTTSEIFDDRA
eukprot:scaffold128087_cov42-Phaeocystis_antarctica.AAC.2